MGLRLDSSTPSIISSAGVRTRVQPRNHCPAL
jgi:hypothetical protein